MCNNSQKKTFMQTTTSHEPRSPAPPPHGVTTRTEERAGDQPGNRSAEIHPQALRRSRRRHPAELTDLPSTLFTGQVEGGKASTNAA